jgi:DNA-binding NarL/FixJ family response regulator
MERIRILLVDDQKLITESFKVLLETECEEVEVVGSAHDGAEAVEKALSLKPDLILMDVRMPQMDGVEATRLIKRAEPRIKVLMLTTFDDDELVAAAIRHGAAGYLLKDISTHQLVASIRSVSQGSVLLPRKAAESMAQASGLAGAVAPAGPPEGARPLVGRAAGEERRRAPDPRILDELSPREIALLKLIARGLENKEIAAELSMAEQTVKNSASRIYQKLGVDGRSEARKLALGLGLISRSI